GLAGDNVRWLGESSDGGIWVISRPGGLVRSDPTTSRVRPVGAETGLNKESLFRGYFGRDGRLWIASAGGLFSNSHANPYRFQKVNPPGVLNRGAWAVAEAPQGVLFVSGVDGLWRLQNHRWSHYGQPEGLLT